MPKVNYKAIKTAIDLLDMQTLKLEKMLKEACPHREIEHYEELLNEEDETIEEYICNYCGMYGTQEEYEGSEEANSNFDKLKGIYNKRSGQT